MAARVSVGVWGQRSWSTKSVLNVIMKYANTWFDKWTSQQAHLNRRDGHDGASEAAPGVVEALTLGLRQRWSSLQHGLPCMARDKYANLTTTGAQAFLDASITRRHCF